MKPLLTCFCLGLLAAVATPVLHAQTITFAAPKTISVGASGTQQIMYPPAIAGDFNGDGKTDYLVGLVDDQQNTELKVLLGNGDGGFSVIPLTNIPNPIDSFLVADVNGDGKDDIITLKGDCDSVAGPCVTEGNGAFSVFLSDGDGHFTPSDRIALPAGIAIGIVGDFNNDRKPDVAVNVLSTNSYDPTVQYLFTNRGNGSFTQSDITAAPPENPQVGPGEFFIGDFNGDGNQDLLFGYSNQIYTVAGHGNGTFDAPRLSYTLDSRMDYFFPADLNGDRKTDLLVGLDARNVNGAWPRMASLFAKQTEAFYWSSAFAVRPADFTFKPYQLPFGPASLNDLNGDGKLDFVALYYVEHGNNLTETIYLYPGLGSGRFASPSTIDLGTSSGHFGLAVAPLQHGRLPSLMFSGRTALLLLVNTTK
jgi:hypothetical protein